MKYLALYLRLSIEDEGDKDESNSITNQRKQIYEYICRDSELSRYEVVEFCDDGYSGTDMERPGMKKLLKEVKENNICCIIVKDMSRFSRDYIELGTYLNQIFPFMGLRFIAINDNYDSRENHGGTIELDTAFRTLLYDLYSKDISVKVKASIENKCANGEYVFGQVPFGYEKSREVKNAVVVNQREAEIVCYIFSLAMKGKTTIQIARQLHEEGVPTIMQLRKPDNVYTDGRVHSWSGNAIRRILNNRFYLGEMAYGKSVRRWVGSKSGISVPMEDWKVIPNHHEALITEEVFGQVSSFGLGYSTKRRRQKHPLTGKLYCGGCGYSMNYKPARAKNRYRRFECRKHSLLKRLTCCTYIRADLLEQLVLYMLNKELYIKAAAIRQKQNLASYQRSGIVYLKRKQREYTSEINRALENKDMLYERYALGRLPVEEYKKGADELTEHISLLYLRADEAASRLSLIEEEYQKAEEDMKEIIKYSHIDELTQDIVDTFIKKIYAYRDKRVEIEWNFADVQAVSNNLP